MKLTKQILEAIQRGINLAIDDFDDEYPIEVQKTGQITHSSNTKEMIIDKYFVDLGLPSGTLWGKYNVGVNPNRLNKASDWYGGYYAWGEIEEKQDYNWFTYKYSNNYFDKLTKYCNNIRYCNNGNKPDNLITLQDEDDIAVQTNKLHWTVKMPTKEQFDELLDYISDEWITNYQGISGLNGMLFISKINSNEIFIPAAGFRAGPFINDVGLCCRMWSSSLHQNIQNNTHSLNFSHFGSYMSAYRRCYGFSVRSVLIKQ